jgi:heme-degrading monooxygenase HmoA
MNEAMLNPVMKCFRNMLTVAVLAIPAQGYCTEVTLSLNQGQVLSFVTTATKQGAEEARRRYDNRVSELASPLGFRREGTLRITFSRAGDYVPDPVMVIHSWLDRASVQKFNSTPEAAELLLAQKDIWDELRSNDVTIPQDIEITFRSDRIYRIVSLWINAEYPIDFYKYRDALSQTVSELGGRYVLHIEGGDYSSIIDPYRPPDLFWIIEWPDRAAHQSYISSDAFRANHQYFESGVEKFNVYETKW